MHRAEDGWNHRDRGTFGIVGCARRAGPIRGAVPARPLCRDRSSLAKAPEMPIVAACLSRLIFAFPRSPPASRSCAQVGGDRRLMEASTGAASLTNRFRWHADAGLSL